MNSEQKQHLDGALWRKNQNVIERLIDGEAVLLDLKTGVYFSLNSSGSAIWGMMSAPVSIAELADRMSREYEVEPATALADARNLIDELASQGLVIEGSE